MGRKWLIGLILVGVGAWAWVKYGARAQFVAGGALVNLGYRLQDPLEDYDLEHHHGTPAQVWTEFVEQNHMASLVRKQWPRSARHPVIALVTCMDARLDTNEITGDTRRYYYVLRLAGSALATKDEEMLALAVANGVKVVVFTTHTDCAAEKVAADAGQRSKYPALAAAVDERKVRFEEFRGLPLIRERETSGALLVKWADLDTLTEKVLPPR
ncbi:MAG: hypothetical protein IT162_13630 [Bryobacterales bacterium]|nr:hypothetical protein [Bryobacterales bacterium]